MIKTENHHQQKNRLWLSLKGKKEVAEYYQYAYDRCHHYPDGFEQLDMLWHAVNDGLCDGLKESEWFKKIDEVKKKYLNQQANHLSSELSRGLR